MSIKDFLFTSESVTEGHPDKVADQISDAILEAILRKDKKARVAVETLVSTGLNIISGEITTDTYVEIPEIVRNKIKEIGYTDPRLGYDYETSAILTTIDAQSKDIASGILKKRLGKFELAAGDQGMVFGFATNETESFMPAPIYYAHMLSRGISELRKSGHDFLKPDGKAQVTLKYLNGKPSEITDIVVSTQHSKETSLVNLREFIRAELIEKSIPKGLIKNTNYLINPAGRFVEGGPKADTGLTGRKIVVDTYGGFSRNGGGAFSGKDPSKVDRSGAYVARYIAKNLVAAGVADKLEVQISYAIGKLYPISIFVEDFGTSKFKNTKILKAIKEFFPLRTSEIITYLDLLNIQYSKIATYGHFGRKDIKLPWESIDKKEELKDYFNI